MNNILTSIKSTVVGLITGGSISIDAIVTQGISKGWLQALIGIGVIILGALINENPTVKTLATDALPVAEALTSPTSELHSIASQLVGALAKSTPVNPAERAPTLSSRALADFLNMPAPGAIIPPAPSPDQPVARRSNISPDGSQPAGAGTGAKVINMPTQP